MRRSGQSPETGAPRFCGFTIVELLVVITIIGVLVALLLPAVQAAREAARQTQCRNNLKQLALACQHHLSATGRFPTGGWGHSWTGDADRGTDLHQPGGWIFNILPYIEQQAMHDMGAGLPTAEKNAANLQRMSNPLSVLYCPTRRQVATYPWLPLIATGGEGVRNVAGTPTMVARSDYAGDFGTSVFEWSPPTGPASLSEGDSDPKGQFANIAKRANGIIYCGSMITMADVTDGASNTYSVGEKSLHPKDYTTGADDGDNEEAMMGADIDVLRLTGRPPIPDDSPLKDDYYRFGSAHAAGFHMAFCDGSVHLVNYTIDKLAHQDLGNRKDGHAVDGSKY